MKQLLILTLILLTVSLGEDIDQVTFDSIFSEEEKILIGSHKLTAQEKEKLKDYIVQFYLLGYEKGKEETKTIKRQYPTPAQSAPSSELVESKIDGDFEGWDGETIIKLFNGQIWQQTEYYYHYHYSFMPSVTIFKSGSSYKMKVDGVDKAVRVKRLK